MRFRYSKLAAEHVEDWRVLMLEGARDFPDGFLITAEEGASMSAERCRQVLESGVIRGVLADERLVGYCGYRPQRLARTRHRAEIGPFFVTSAYQGSGAARAMMQGVVDEARASGIEQLELFVVAGNHRAIAFYERQGFERVAIHPDGVRIDGVPRDAYFCRLCLPP